MADRPLQMRTVEGAPIVVGDRQIVPVAQAVSFTARRPWGGVGFVWNRPVAVLEVTEAGRQRIPVRDVTRRIQIGLLVAGLLISLMIRLAARQRVSRR